MTAEPSKTVELGGVVYEIGKLDAMKQFHLARRIAPIMTALAGAAGNIGDFGKAKEGGQLFTSLLGPVFEEISKKSDEEIDHIIFPCLAAVRRQIAGGGWAQVKVAGANKLMYEDMDATVIMRLTMEVIEANLASFFHFAAPTSPATEDAAAK